MPQLDPQQKKWIDDTIKRLGLNEYGDAPGTMYTGGTPLFNEMSGKTIDRYDYIISRHKDWLPQSK
jgi:hypothetical protein